MRTSLIAMGAAVGLLVWSSSARAQQAVEVPSAPAALPGQAAAAVDAAQGLPVVQGVLHGVIEAEAPAGVDGQPVQTHPYSYYVVFPEPARTYVGYGPVDQFPFQGQAYGRPGDRWSWTGMMGNRAAGLDRYYYQLLP